jgi:uncharacterized protein (TIGR03083 family)
MMEIEGYVEHIRRDGVLLADAAERAGLGAPVPTCPDWLVRDLVRHQGDVHRWAAANLVRGSSEPMSDDEAAACLLTWPDGDTALLPWFREGHTNLVNTIDSTPDDAVAFTFLPAPSARAFWARRQAHETAIHRADAESATGEITAYDATLAADGIDEMVGGFAARPGRRFVSDPARTLLMEATDVGRRWWLTVGPEALTVGDNGSNAECAVAGRASDLYLLVWNRRTADGLDVSGDTELLGLWRESQRIRWGGPSKK